MRGFLIFLVLAGLGVFFVLQKQNPTSAAAKSAAIQSSAKEVNSPPAQLTPAPRGQASQHNWMKRALDRAADVRDQSRAQTKDAQGGP